MNTIAGIVTYNPDILRLEKNLNAIKGQVCRVVIVDNNSSNILEIKKYVRENIYMIENNANFGIAKALNQIMNYARENHFEWVLTLDQDSVCPQSFMKNLIKHIGDNIGIVCPKVYDLNKKDNIQDSLESNYIDKCITSGSLTSVEAWEKIGKFDETMFIDGVDFEFCYRLKSNGYFIYRVDDVELAHEIGHITIRKFLLWNICVKNHSAFRKYYIAKNIIYFAKKRKKIKFKIKAFFQEVKLMGIVLIYEEDKTNKIKRIIKGIKDGIKNKKNKD